MYINQLLEKFLIPVIIQTDSSNRENPRIQSSVVKLFFKLTNTAERIVSDTTNTIILKNNEHLTHNQNPETLGREKNFNYLSKSLLAIGMITYYFFNGGLKRKPFSLFTGTLLLLKIPNHYTYNRKDTDFSRSLIHDIALVILCYSAALVKPKHVYLIKRAGITYLAVTVISKIIKNYYEWVEFDKGFCEYMQLSIEEQGQEAEYVSSLADYLRPH